MRKQATIQLPEIIIGKEKNSIEQITDLLTNSKKPLNSKTIMKKINMNYSTVQTSLSRLVNIGKIKSKPCDCCEVGMMYYV